MRAADPDTLNPQAEWQRPDDPAALLRGITGVSECRWHLPGCLPGQPAAPPAGPPDRTQRGGAARPAPRPRPRRRARARRAPPAPLAPPRRPQQRVLLAREEARAEELRRKAAKLIARQNAQLRRRVSQLEEELELERARAARAARAAADVDAMLDAWGAGAFTAARVAAVVAGLAGAPAPDDAAPRDPGADAAAAAAGAQMMRSQVAVLRMLGRAAAEQGIDCPCPVCRRFGAHDSDTESGKGSEPDGSEPMSDDAIAPGSP